MTINNAANFLIALYRKTEYRCDKRKLQKLIIYADFIHFATKNTRLLSDNEVTASERGLSLDNLTDPIYSLTFNSINERKPIVEEIDITNLQDGLNPILHYELNEIEINYLFYVFKMFGAYSGDDLTAMSKATDIWKFARPKELVEKKYYVTEHIYKKVIDEKILTTADDFVDDNSGIKDKIVKYLLSKLDEADKINEEEMAQLWDSLKQSVLEAINSKPNS